MTKTALIARFSNGHTDAYKGRRDVTAAWMVITPEGKIVSGHSLDIARACATAANACGETSPHRQLKMVGTRGRDIVSPAFAKWAHAVAVKEGFANRMAYNADAAAKHAKWIEECKVEVVGL